MDNTPNIILIGMAGCGKSTIGKLLARSLSYDFVDTDKLIEDFHNKPLQEIVDQGGPEAFRTIEENLLVSLQLSGTVVATGGSSVYSEKGLQHLRHNGVIVYLDVDLATLGRRVDNESTRGLVRKAGQSFSDLYHERMPLYLQQADYRFTCLGKTEEEVCRGIVALLEDDGRL